MATTTRAPKIGKREIPPELDMVALISAKLYPNKSEPRGTKAVQ